MKCVCVHAQALFANDSFVAALLARGGSPGDTVTLRTRRVMALLALSFQRSVSAADLHAALPEPFNGYGQQDATEFARLLLDSLSSVEEGLGAGPVAAGRDEGLAAVRACDTLYSCFACCCV